MGIAKVLVRSVFPKSQFTKIRESNVKSSAVGGKRWSSVRAYLCGDEFKQVQEVEDSASVKCLVAAVTETPEDHNAEIDNIQSEEPQKESPEEDEVDGPIRKSIELQEAAAVVIQSAFRGSKVRSQLKVLKTAVITEEYVRGRESPGRISLGTSVEVQTAHSVDAVSTQEESTVTPRKTQQKQKPQVLKAKDNWDDSTLNSNLSKVRAQKRMEAMTRRERALAYAFSQQLRHCSKRKQVKTEGSETNVGWSWLERWMATRVPEGSPVDCQPEQPGPLTDMTRPVIRKKFLDLSVEEKESCGSNEISFQNHRSETPASEGKEQLKPDENRPVARKSVSRKKTVPTGYSPTGDKASKKDNSCEKERNETQKEMHAGQSKQEDSLEELSSPSISKPNALELSVNSQAGENSQV